MLQVLLVALAASAPELKPASAVETSKPKLVILEVTAGGGIDPTVAEALGASITREVNLRGYFQATSIKELQTLLGIERQRQLLGCSDAAAQSCMAELADAIGARFVLSGSLTRLGDAFQLSLQTIDTTRAQPIGRSVRIARDPQVLTEQLPFAVAEATATTLPPPPSRALQLTMLITGGVILLSSGVVALDGTSRDRAVQAELEASQTNPSLLRPLSSYRDDARFVTLEKTAALVGLIVGGALVAGGVLFWPSSSSSSGTAQVALVPLGSGAAVVGVFP
ncbi:MAG: hypothetical protein IPJ65_34440 [Archangiaceae bacterium]|nr:hypothetical protein [Archangiaceae bacterium]